MRRYRISGRASISEVLDGQHGPPPAFGRPALRWPSNVLSPLACHVGAPGHPTRGSTRSGEALTVAGESSQLTAIRSAGDLAALIPVFDVETPHEAYLAAKPVWRAGVTVDLEWSAGLPGQRVQIDGIPFWIHGVTHAGTDAERRRLREAVTEWLGADESVYTEQGIRRLYFQDIEAVCQMDDYRWAMARCRELEVETHASELGEANLDGRIEKVGDQFREATFSLIEAGRDVYGARFAGALGDVATAFLTDHADLATRKEFEAFARSQRAAADPDALENLQRYYHRSFLPQPLEREWLRAHDPELEVVTHARNERMAAYALAHHEGTEAVHLIVGAAHQPGVAYYLEQYRDGAWQPQYEPVTD